MVKTETFRWLGMFAGFLWIRKVTRKYQKKIYRSLRINYAVEMFRHWLRWSPAGRKLAMEVRQELAGKDLACWCPLKDKSGNSVPCHADVLLQIASEQSA